MNSLFQRYIWLADIIYRSGRITFEEINRKWLRNEMSGGKEMPLRTFHNHRQAIEDLFDINIECDKRDGYVYYIENKDDIEHGGIRTWLLNTFAVNNLINESHKLKRRILFEQIPSGQRFLTAAIEAMCDGLCVEVAYQSFWSDEASVLELEPYCVKVFRQRWYLLAFNPCYKALRTYAFDRMLALHLTEKTFRLPQDFDAQRFFENNFGIIVDRDIEPCRLEIKVYDSNRQYLQTLPLHHSQEETETTEAYSVFTYFLSPTFDFKQEILSHGEEIEVLSPQWFRDEMRGTALKINELYNK